MQSGETGCGEWVAASRPHSSHFTRLAPRIGRISAKFLAVTLSGISAVFAVLGRWIFDNLCVGRIATTRVLLFCYFLRARITTVPQ
jgi:hypothetical protein